MPRTRSGSGGSRPPRTDGCSSASKTTTASAVAPSSTRPCSRTWRGLASTRTTVPSASRTGWPSPRTWRRSTGCGPAVSSTAATARGRPSPPGRPRPGAPGAVPDVPARVARAPSTDRCCGSRLALGPSLGTTRSSDGRRRRSRPRGDLAIRDRHGNWTYGFAVVVDDARQGVDLVVRGQDLVDATGSQIRLARLLGRSSPPRFLHHPLIRRPDGRKLSKSSGDTGIREMRATGLSPGEVRAAAAAASGWN